MLLPAPHQCLNAIVGKTTCGGTHPGPVTSLAILRKQFIVTP
jgi:hypothetical protein